MILELETQPKSCKSFCEETVEGLASFTERRGYSECECLPAWLPWLCMASVCPWASHSVVPAEQGWQPEPLCGPEAETRQCASRASLLAPSALFVMKYNKFCSYSHARLSLCLLVLS